MIDIDQLEAVAKAATPAKWTLDKPVRDKDGWSTGVAVAGTPGRQGIYASPDGGSFPAGDARHIATFDPPTVLALIAELRAARAALVDWRYLYTWGHCWHLMDDACKQPQCVKGREARLRLGLDTETEHEGT
jgi:hypothetical protein